MSDQPASSVLLALSTGFAEPHPRRRAEPRLHPIRARTLDRLFLASGLIVAAENALPDEGEHSILAHDGASSPAQIVGRDPSTDVALLRIGRTDLPKAQSAAAGAAAGALAFVAGAREGAVNAALGRRVILGAQWRSLRGGLIDARIELDATLARASEGGLALDASGQALGMAVFGPRRRTLVIPTATIDRVADVLATKGRIVRGYLGLGLQPVKLDSGGIGAIAISVDAKGQAPRQGSGRATSSWPGTANRSVASISSCARSDPTVSARASG